VEAQIRGWAAHNRHTQADSSRAGTQSRFGREIARPLIKNSQWSPFITSEALVRKDRATVITELPQRADDSVHDRLTGHQQMPLWYGATIFRLEPVRYAADVPRAWRERTVRPCWLSRTWNNLRRGDQELPRACFINRFDLRSSTYV
jgi:hypothetical protein